MPRPTIPLRGTLNLTKVGRLCTGLQGHDTNSAHRATCVGGTLRCSHGPGFARLDFAPARLWFALVTGSRPALGRTTAASPSTCSSEEVSDQFPDDTNSELWLNWYNGKHYTRAPPAVSACACRVRPRAPRPTCYNTHTHTHAFEFLSMVGATLRGAGQRTRARADAAACCCGSSAASCCSPWRSGCLGDTPREPRNATLVRVGTWQAM